MLKKIKNIFCSTCTVLGFLVIIIFFGGIGLNLLHNKSIKPSEKTLLTINFDDNFSEAAEASLLNEIIGNNTLNFLKLLQTIDYAAEDPNIIGIVARINTSNLNLAQIQEIAAAIDRFKEHNKKTYIFSKGFGPFGQGNREYYLASFFDEIYMQPHTYIGLTGMDIEIPFARNVLDKIGINPEFYSRYEYKTAMISLTDSEMPKPYKENLTSLMTDLMTSVKNGINENRALTKDIDTIINRAPLSAKEGKKLNLIDDIMYLPQLEDKLKDEGVKHFMNIIDYSSMLQPNNDAELPVIAILNLRGIISDGDSSVDFDGEFTIGSDSVLSDLSEIEKINNLRALIVRIDSPGGAYNASEEIYFALNELKQNKKIPIIISQSGYAASGGYYISLAGDTIIAEPTTITGSIGVLGGKFSLTGLWQKLGINWQKIKLGENADILSVNSDFTASEKKIFNASLDEVYNDFTQKVMQHRTLTKDINEIARGRVWTGNQAKQLGLIDAVGGYDEAIKQAFILSKISPNQRYNLITFPKEKSFREKIRDLMLSPNVIAKQIIMQSGVDIRYLKLFKQLQYDTVLLPFNLTM